MTTITEIKYSRLEDRFDSEYYKPEYLEVESVLEKNKFNILLKNVVKKSNKTFNPSKNIADYFYYIEIDGINLINGNFSFTKLKNYEAPSRARKKLEYGDIFISTVRPNRNAVGLFLDKSDSYVCSTGFCVIKPEKINPYFLFIFLKTKYSVYQLIRNTSAAMYPAVSEQDILNMKIINPPQPFQLRIEKLVKEAFSKRKLAEEKYEQAKQLLEKELGIDKLRLKEEKTFEANFSSLNQNLRFDSEYYKPKYKQITEFLKNSGFEVKKLKEVVKISDKKINPTKEPTKKFRYVPIAKINQNGEIEEWDEFSGWQAPSRARMLIKKGDVLVSSLGGSIDKIALVPEELNNSLATTGAFVINSDNFYSEFLFLLFRTELIKLQLEQKTAGAIMTAVPKTTFGDLLIPLIPKSNQEQISTLVRESFSLRKESKNLLEESKKIVETAIENGTRK